MIFLRIWTFSFCLLPFALPAHALAQDPKITAVSLRFLFLDETSDAYSVKTGATYQQLTSTPYVIGRPVVAKPTDRLEIFKSSPTPDPITGKIIRIKIATITPPENTTSALVVITPHPVDSGSTAAPVYGVTFFDSDPRAFPPKSIRILNLDHISMAAQFGTAQIVVQPSTAQLVQPDTDSRNRVFSKIAAQTPAGWKVLYDSITIVRPNERVTGVFVYSPSGLLHTFTREEIMEKGLPPPGHFWLTYSEMP